MSTYATNLKKNSWINIIDATTEQGKRTQADTEKANYVFSQIPNSEFLTLEDTAKDIMHVIAKVGKGTEQRAICSCKYFKESGNICEHIIAMKDVDMDKLDATNEAILSFLRATNWHDDENGRFVPPDKEDEVIDEPKTAPAKPASKDVPKPAPKKETPKKEKPPTKKTNAQKAREEKHGTAVAKADAFPDDREFTDAETERYLANKGQSYTSQSGTKVPNSAAMSRYGLEHGVSTETVDIGQDETHAWATVRGHKGGRYADSSVIFHYSIMKEQILIKMAKKYPKALIEWRSEGSIVVPSLDLSAMVAVGTKSVMLGEHIFNTLVDKKWFAARTAETMAKRRVHDELAGIDWRSDAEKEAEAEEVEMVQKSRR